MALLTALWYVKAVKIPGRFRFINKLEFIHASFSNHCEQKKFKCFDRLPSRFVGVYTCIYELSANESDGIKSTEYFGPLLIGVIFSLYALIKISTSGTSYIYNLTIIISIFSTHKTNITI